VFQLYQLDMPVSVLLPERLATFDVTGLSAFGYRMVYHFFAYQNWKSKKIFLVRTLLSPVNNFNSNLIILILFRRQKKP